MLTFRQFIVEVVSGTLPREQTMRGEPEHDEVTHQLNAPPGTWHPDVHAALTHLSDPKNFKKALANSNIARYTPQRFENVGNTDVGTPISKLPGIIDRRKLERAKETNTPGPIILRVHNSETGKIHEHLVGGNTAATVRGGHVFARVIHHTI